MDGLQAEKTFNKITLGVVAGTRPDYTDYGFNKNLLQYGGYLAFDTKKDDIFTQSSLAFMEQMNNMKTDRRFLYFQHSSSLLKNLYFFGTFEVDLYKVQNFHSSKHFRPYKFISIPCVTGLQGTSLLLARTIRERMFYSMKLINH